MSGSAISCPDHGSGCIWYQHNSDNVGWDLGVGDGIRSGVDFARCHTPMGVEFYPVSDCRGDYYAIGFFRGVIQEWCVDHETWDCLGTWRCASKVALKVTS